MYILYINQIVNLIAESEKHHIQSDQSTLSKIDPQSRLAFSKNILISEISKMPRVCRFLAESIMLSTFYHIRQITFEYDFMSFNAILELVCIGKLENGNLWV